MRILIAAIGKPRRSPEQSLVELYVKRLPWEVKMVCFESNKATAAARQREECDWLMQATRDVPQRMALDERGELFTSQAFAERFRAFQMEGDQRVAFMLGGPDGLLPDARASCQRILSLGKMTLPHLLARVVLLEQLYRAQTILSGHPYHRA